MGAVRTIPPKAIYKDWLGRLIVFVKPSKGSEPTVIGFINDTYRKIGIKNRTRKLRSEAGKNTYIDGFEQHMPQGIKWNEFLCNSANKEELTKLISNYLQTDELQTNHSSRYSNIWRSNIHNSSCWRYHCNHL